MLHSIASYLLDVCALSEDLIPSSKPVKGGCINMYVKSQVPLRDYVAPNWSAKSAAEQMPNDFALKFGFSAPIYHDQSG